MKGKKMICPFCFNEHRELLKFGVQHELFDRLKIIGGGERQSLCPTCGSTDRERLVFVFLVDYVKIFKREQIRILHIAPERNIYRYLEHSEQIDYVVGSLYHQQYQFVKCFSTIDLTKTIFLDNSFDLIICNHVLEHIQEEHSALSEIKRILKARGKAILQVPIAEQLKETFEDRSLVTPSERLNHYGQRDHVRLYGRDYGKRLAKHGFKVENYKLASEYPLLGLNEKETLYVVSK